MLIACVGKPSVGKSTFFKACTLADVAIASYPFTTIKPNRGTAFVSLECVDKEFNKQCNPRIGYCVNGKRFVAVELLDVAGLVENAYLGEGLGNMFLNDLSTADALIHIVDISGSTNAKGESVPALSYDPLNDIKFLERELDMWYLGLVKKGWDKFLKQYRIEKGALYKAVSKQLSGLGVTEDVADEVLRSFNSDINLWTENDLFNFIVTLRKKTKPIIIAANKIDIDGAEENYKRIKEQFTGYIIIPCSADSELALREASKAGLINYIPGEKTFEIKKELNEKQKKALEHIQKNILDKYGSTGVQEVLNKAVFDLLKYIAIFPGGVNKLTDSEGRTLPDVFLMKDGSTALDFAYKLHTDFGKNFIRAIDVKKKMTVGKEHKLKNKDVIEIIT
ncbi:MAG: redox-regulated ATPase YchF [Nanoarchaeota archaeon]